MTIQGMDNKILVQSANVEIGDALNYHCHDKIVKTMTKLFGHLNSAIVHFKHEGSAFECSIKIKVGALKPWTATNTNRNAFRAFNNALENVATQMRRAKRELHEDKPFRLDKDKFLTGSQTTTQKRKLLVPEPTDVNLNIDKTDLTTMQGADDYAKAMLQKAKQDETLRAEAEDIEAFRRANHREAAE